MLLFLIRPRRQKSSEMAPLAAVDWSARICEYLGGKSRRIGAAFRSSFGWRRGHWQVPFEASYYSSLQWSDRFPSFG